MHGESGLRSLRELDDEALAWLRDAAIDTDGLRRYALNEQASVRQITRRRIVVSNHGVDRQESQIVRVEREGVALVSSTLQDVQLVDRVPAARCMARPTEAMPLHFVSGSGAVLMHEAIGHPAEQNDFITWPDWLRVTDDPTMNGLGMCRVDDTGRETVLRQLVSDSPSAYRRGDHRDLPLNRMTNVVVSARFCATEPAPRRIVIELVDHGTWDAARDLVILRIVRSTLHDHESAVPLLPWRFAMTRAAVSRSLSATSLAVELYPGVICSSAGQDIGVGSASCDLVVVEEPR